MSKQQNKQNVQGASNKRILLKRMLHLNPLLRNKLVIQLQKERSMKLGKQSQEKHKKRGDLHLLFLWKSVDFQNYNQIPWFLYVDFLQ